MIIAQRPHINHANEIWFKLTPLVLGERNLELFTNYLVKIHVGLIYIMQKTGKIQEKHGIWNIY